MRVYKIQDTQTGLFSEGGVDVTWGKHGKTWNTLAHVKAHLNQLVPYFIPSTWVLVPFDMEASATVPVKDLLK